MSLLPDRILPSRESTWAKSTFDGELAKYGAQITALGNGKFHSLGYYGGLPGDGWDESNLYDADGQLNEGAVVFTHQNGITGTIRVDVKGADGKPGTDGILTIKGPQGGTRGTLKKIFRTSPTLGEKPPAGAIVLFDGMSADAFVDGRVKDGLLLAGATSKQKFQSFKIHLEFLVPFGPPPGGKSEGTAVSMPRAAMKRTSSIRSASYRKRTMRLRSSGSRRRGSTCPTRRFPGRPTTSTSPRPYTTAARR